MANMAGRQMTYGPKASEWNASGGWAREIASGKQEIGATYVLGEGWGEMPEDELYGRAVTRSAW